LPLLLGEIPPLPPVGIVPVLLDELAPPAPVATLVLLDEAPPPLPDDVPAPPADDVLLDEALLDEAPLDEALLDDEVLVLLVLLDEALLLDAVPPSLHASTSGSGPVLSRPKKLMTKLASIGVVCPPFASSYASRTENPQGFFQVSTV
jgi:hypothetical protein